METYADKPLNRQDGLILETKTTLNKLAQKNISKTHPNLYKNQNKYIYDFIKSEQKVPERPTKVDISISTYRRSSLGIGGPLVASTGI